MYLEQISADFLSFFTLFVHSFLAATVLPFPSEATFSYLIIATPSHWLSLWLVASVANSLGSMSGYFLGRLATLKPLKINRPILRQSYNYLQRFGVFLLLLSWLPVVGDFLCLAAGYLRLPWLLCLVVIILAKTLRYLLLVFLLNIF